MMCWTVYTVNGFTFEGQRISLVGQQGIWKPKVFEFIPLSIRTSYQSDYRDGVTADGLLYYRYRGTDPRHRDNAGLREAMHKQVPLVYFHGLVPESISLPAGVHCGEDPVNWPCAALDDRRSLD